MPTIDDTAPEAIETCPPHSVISRDLPCVGCSYNLRTMPVTGKCSECGLAVERSLLVLPRSLKIAKAIRLTAYVVVVSFVGLFVPPVKMVAMVMLLWAAHRLHHRCKLSHMSDLGPKVRWFWITIVISAMVLTLSVTRELTRGEYRLLRSAPIGSSITVSTRQTPGGQATVVAYSDLEGSVEVTTDAQGRREVALLDYFGSAISTSTLAAGQSASVKDAAGQTVRLNLDAAGMLTIQARPSSKVQVSSNGFTTLVTMPAGYLGTLLTAVQVLVGLAAIILYLLVCRALAIRSNNLRLSWWFTIIFRLIVTAAAVLAAVIVGRILGLAAIARGIALMLPASVALLCLLVAAVTQIMASFQLSSALRQAPRHWSEVATVPNGG